MGADVTEHPIAMSTWSMQRILAGAKTQTRRLISPQPQFHFDRPLWQWVWTCHPRSKTTISTSLPPNMEAFCVPWHPGDLLWVREPLVKNRHTSIVLYEVDQCPAWKDGSTASWPWKRDHLPSIFCPRWASRLTLRVKSLRAELIQDISHEDCLAEGVLGGIMRSRKTGKMMSNARGRFFIVWYRLYAKRVGTLANPWVWVTEFERAC